MRLDKYLKISRLIKRRTVANEACDNGRVTLNGRVAPSATGRQGWKSSPYRKTSARKRRQICSAIFRRLRPLRKRQDPGTIQRTKQRAQGSLNNDS